jgi:adenylate kinase
LVLLGPPGVGKGTQAELLCRALGACHLSIDDVFRAAQGLVVAPGSAMARAHACMERGEPVSDDVVLGLIRERSRCLHCSCGFVLDGFPRTARQAQALDRLLAAEHQKLDAVISYELSAADQPGAVKARLEAHAADIAPLTAHYRAMGLFVTVNAVGRPEDVFAHTLDALAELVLPAKPPRPSPSLSSSSLAASSSNR